MSDCPDTLMPFDTDAIGGSGTKPPNPDAPMLLGAEFAYIGRGLTLPQFAAYVAAYDFGSAPPDYVVLHHTAIPSASWAPLGSPANFWDAHETGLDDQAIYDKRKARLDGIMRYYRDALGWDRGPHLFVDDRYIWLFTPMYDIGIHAAAGNSYRTGKKLHYSIGIEVIGYYEHVVWPAPVARLVGGAVALIKQRIKTFDYIDGPWAGKIGAHRMYNKPACPGAAITPAFYLPVLQRAWQDLIMPQPVNPAARMFVVKAGAGANVRQGKTMQAKILDVMRGGQFWSGTVVQGQKVKLKPYGETDEWVCDDLGRCVWRGLLNEL